MNELLWAWWNAFPYIWNELENFSVGLCTQTRKQLSSLRKQNKHYSYVYMKINSGGKSFFSFCRRILLASLYATISFLYEKCRKHLRQQQVQEQLRKRFWCTRSYFKDEGLSENTISWHFQKSFIFMHKRFLRRYVIFFSRKQKFFQIFIKATFSLNPSSLKWDFVNRNRSEELCLYSLLA